jgi:uncharacterized protein (TIGR02466 family)
MYKIHQIFPTVVYQGNIDTHEEIKEKYLNELITYSSYENFSTPENSGNIFLHREKKYKLFFDSLKSNINQYMRCLEIDISKLKYHVVKSWVNHYSNNMTPSHGIHTHNESNVSFCYYLKTDESSDKFCLRRDINPNEVVGAMFEMDNLNLIQKYNQYNCDDYTITPTEGSVVVFPSNLKHYTKKITNRKSNRVSIAGDIRITLTESDFYYYQGCTHPNQWTEL